LKDGVVGLSGGDVRRRYAYFRDLEFVQFLHDYRITTVKRADPDGTYYGHSEYSARLQETSELLSDGIVETKWDERWNGAPEYQTYSGSNTWEVTNSTWVLLREGSHTTLITRRPLGEIRDILPNFTKIQEDAENIFKGQPGPITERLIVSLIEGQGFMVWKDDVRTSNFSIHKWSNDRGFYDLSATFEPLEPNCMVFERRNLQKVAVKWHFKLAAIEEGGVSAGAALSVTGYKKTTE
jgi:hypothetical protein